VRVVGQLLRWDLVSLPRELLERREHLSVQSASLPSEQVSVDSLPREYVPKCEPLVGFLDHELRPDQLLEDRQQPAFVDAKQHLEQREVEAAAGHRCDLHDSSSAFAKAVHAALNAIVHSARNTHRAGSQAWIGRGDRTSHRFFDEEWVPLSESEDHLQQIGAHRRADDGLNHGLCLSPTQG
jgi:hypothetical protein